MRRAVVALLLLAGALVAPASSAASTQFENQCQYSYDRYWRPVPLVFDGRLTDGSGTELTPGAQLAVGDTVRSRGGTVSALLPSWIVTFAYESSMIPLGDGAVARQGVARARGDEHGGRRHARRSRSTRSPARTSCWRRAGSWTRRGPRSGWRPHPIPTQSWTATGGEVAVRQALGESLGPIPVAPGRQPRPLRGQPVRGRGADVPVRRAVPPVPGLPAGRAGQPGRDAHGCAARACWASSACPGTAGRSMPRR